MNYFFRLKKNVNVKKRKNKPPKRNNKPHKKKSPKNSTNFILRDVNPLMNQTSIVLLIGIVYYNENYTSQQLYGCINDVNMIKQFLIKRGFQEKNIMCMTDGKETSRDSEFFPKKEKILARLNNLLRGEVVDNTGKVIYKTNNKNCLCYYSAHGSNIVMNSPIRFDTQYNQLDFIIPYDYNPNIITSIISDIEIKDIINNNSFNRFKLSMFFDSCVNQTVCNLAYGYYSTLNDNNRQYAYQRTNNNITQYTNVNIVNKCQVFQMSGSTEKQYSIDVNNGIVLNGAYTMAFLSCFNNPLQVLTWKDFLMRKRSWLKNNGYTQIPQLSSAQLANIDKEYINF